MSAEHTWGEGVVVNNPDCPHSETGSNAASVYWGSTYVADVYRGYVGSESVSRNEQAANARLIAAAPGLLRVAQLVKEAADHRSDKDWPMLHLALSEAAEAAVAALAKVAGEQA